ncbi:hypothetical protein NEOLEDRAFT_1140308 [Neolentinus lepideus HHB14362 ss-1]|uniref:Protein argonaute N-terminal domain-containing protein n=1 Tax=Neolentinus lepideus HHB14362 ss-1 TaxID=1314782 RepID=A0A165PB06_9AGAM|nr:hypothetical protein NEOLEDRAFT_1140308 [Neolentinus lepideus HHB14362 ss-1]
MSARPPPVGRAGRKVSVTANTFSLSWRDDAEGFYHYDAIEVIGATKPPSRKKAYEIVTRTQTDNPHIFTARAGFDGNKNLW